MTCHENAVKATFSSPCELLDWQGAVVENSMHCLRHLFVYSPGHYCVAHVGVYVGIILLVCVECVPVRVPLLAVCSVQFSYRIYVSRSLIIKIMTAALTRSSCK